MQKDLLRTAVDAGLPVITVSTTDPTRALSCIHHIVNGSQGTPPRRFVGAEKRIEPKTLYWADWSLCAPVPDIVRRFRAADRTQLIVINSREEILGAFDAGELMPPRSLMQSELRQLGVQHGPELLEALDGLTLTEMEWALRLASVIDKEITPESIGRVRSRCWPPRRGLQPVNRAIEAYAPIEHLESWISRETPFLAAEDRRLRPRGLLFTGPPGTGKTLGAKRIAQVIGRPLFRFDLGDVKDRYHGESEKALTQTFARVEAEAPCVLLIDEVEKLFAPNSGDSGTTQALLSQMLWWLAEHDAHVLTIMTTNDHEALPKELVRPGRIDKALAFHRLLNDKFEPVMSEIWPVVETVVDSFNLPSDAVRVTTLDRVSGELKALRNDGTIRLSHAAVTQIVVGAVKESLS